MEINGAKCTDAKKALHITITKQDVRTGSTKDPAACAAAKALCRQTGCSEARVHIARTYLKVNDQWMRYKTPGSLRSEIIAFDRGGTFEPGDYLLTPVQPTVRLGAKKRRAGRKQLWFRTLSRHAIFCPSEPAQVGAHPSDLFAPLGAIG